MSVDCEHDASHASSPGEIVCFDVYSRTASKTCSPGRSFFSNCLPVHRIDAIIFQVSFYDIFVSQFCLPRVNSPYIICLGRRSMGIRCMWPRKAVNGHTVYVTKEGGQWAYGVHDHGRRSMGIRCTWPRKVVNGHTVYVTKEGGQWAYGVRDQGRQSMGIRCTWPSQRSRLCFRMLLSEVELEYCRMSRF